MLSNNVLLYRSSEDEEFMEDFSDMLLLKLLNASITASDDNEKVCALLFEAGSVLWIDRVQE